MKQKIVIKEISNEGGHEVTRHEFVSDNQTDAIKAARKAFKRLQETGKFNSQSEFNLTHLEMFDESEQYNKQETKKLDVQDRSESRTFGGFIIDVIAAYNKKNFNQAQVFALLSNPAMGGITLALLTGAIETARAGIMQYGPTMYPADFVAQVVKAMNDHIAEVEPEAEEPTGVLVDDPMPQAEDLEVPEPAIPVQTPPDMGQGMGGQEQITQGNPDAPEANPGDGVGQDETEDESSDEAV